MIIYVDLKNTAFTPTLIDAAIAGAKEKIYDKLIVDNENTQEPFRVVVISNETTPVTTTSYLRYSLGYQVLLYPIVDEALYGRAVTTDLTLAALHGDDDVVVLITDDSSYTYTVPLFTSYGRKLIILGTGL